MNCIGVIQEWIGFALPGAIPAIPEEWISRSSELQEEVLADIRCDFLRKYLEEDWNDEARFRWKLHTDAAFQAVLLYRISRHLFLKHSSDPLLDALAYLMRFRTGMEIYYSSDIGEGFRVMHGSGVIVGPRHRIGKNCTVYQGVTLGQRQQNSPQEFLEVGDDCVFFAGAKVLGRLRIGDRVRVAANAVLLCDAEDGATYGGVPARRLG